LVGRGENFFCIKIVDTIDYIVFDSEIDDGLRIMLATIKPPDVLIE